MVSKLWHSFVMSTLCVMALLAIHFVLPSMLNNFSRDYSNFSLQKVWGHTFLTETWQNHTTLPAFAARPVTSWLIDGVHRVFDLSYAYSFIGVEFGFLLLCGTVLYFLSERKYAVWTVVAFFGSFTILFAFLSPIYSYDEPLQYFCFFLTFLLLERKRYILSGTFLFLALLTRETTLFLLPSLFLFILPQRMSLVKRGLFIAGPLLAMFVSVRLYLWHIGLLDEFTAYTGERFAHFAINFQNNGRGIESIVSIFLATLLPAFLSLSYYKRHGMDENEKRYFWAFILAGVINTPIVLATALAQEARLFALPLLFIWPFLGKYAAYFFQSVKESVSILARPFILVGFLLIGAISVYLSFFFYIPTALWTYSPGFQGYFLAVLLLTGWRTLLALRRP